MLPVKLSDDFFMPNPVSFGGPAGQVGINCSHWRFNLLEDLNMSEPRNPMARLDEVEVNEFDAYNSGD